MPKFNCQYLVHKTIQLDTLTAIDCINTLRHYARAQGIADEDLVITSVIEEGQSVEVTDLAAEREARRPVLPPPSPPTAPTPGTPTIRAHTFLEAKAA